MPKDGLSKDVAYAGNTERRCKIKFVRWQHKVNIADDSDNDDDDDDEGSAKTVSKWESFENASF